MRPSPIVLMLLLCAAGAFAQSDQYVISRQGSVTIFPAYQTWSAKDAGTSFSQVSGTISAYIPAGRSLGFSLRGSGEGSSGDVAALNGLSDAQLGVQYYVEPFNTIFTLGMSTRRPENGNSPVMNSSRPCCSATACSTFRCRSWVRD